MKKVFIIWIFLLISVKSHAWIDSVYWNKTFVPHTVSTHGFMGLGSQIKYIDQYFINASDTLQIDLVFTDCAALAAVYPWDSLISIPSSVSQPYYYLIVRAILDSNSVTPNCDIQDRYIDTIFSNVNAPTSLVVFDDSKNFRLFPNPARDKLNIEVANKQSAVIRIYNLLGLLEIKKSFNDEIDISTLSSGIHIIEIRADNIIYRNKFFKE